MRCFIEIDLPENVKKHIEEKITHLENRIFGQVHSLRPAKKGNLHVTLAFLGEINEKELEEAIINVSEIAKKFAAFECSLSKIEAYPTKFPRLIWISLSDNRELFKLYCALKKALNLKEEHGGFKAHITIARIRPDKSTRTSTNNSVNIMVNEIEIEPLKFSVNEIKIMQSILKNEGAEYELIKSIPFGTA